jgi:class 3 adenylate cyclase
MQRIIDRFSTETGRDLKLRAGIDTGAVSSGLIGRTSLAYDLWGQAVNLAYQVQSGAPQAGIYVTTEVHEAMRDARQFASAGTITVDGSEQPVWRLS